MTWLWEPLFTDWICQGKILKTQNTIISQLTRKTWHWVAFHHHLVLCSYIVYFKYRCYLSDFLSYLYRQRNGDLWENRRLSLKSCRNRFFCDYTANSIGILFNIQVMLHAFFIYWFHSRAYEIVGRYWMQV